MQNLNNKNALDKYDLNEIKNEIEQTVKEYKNPIIESSKVENLEEKVNENNIENLQNKEPLIQKISVNLDDKTVDIAPKNDEIDNKQLNRENIL